MVGDFNGHHTIWDPSLPYHKINQCGKQLSKYIIEHRNLALITTPGLKTYTHTTNRSSNSSTLDLAIFSSNFIQICETALMGDLGRDHTPVMIIGESKTGQKDQKSQTEMETEGCQLVPLEVPSSTSRDHSRHNRGRGRKFVCNHHQHSRKGIWQNKEHYQN